MSLIKLAVEQQSFVKRHPIIAGGIALTGGLAAADAGLTSFNKIRELGGGKSGAFMAGLNQLKNNNYGARKAVANAAKHGLGQGALYGGILSTVEPAILNGAFKKKPE